jgi:Asparagine synthase
VNRQYVISFNQSLIPKNYSAIELGHGAVLGIARDLEVYSLLCDGVRVHLVGHPLDLGHRLSCPTRHNFEEFIYEFAGSFIAVTEIDDQLRVYLDPSGLMPLVYSEKLEMAAANPHLISGSPYDYDDDHREISIENDGWFPFGLTSKSGVKRVLPNHYLDLLSWSIHRHWHLPRSSGRRSFRENVEAVANRLTTTIQTIAAKHPIALALTGGYDSRTLLACAGSAIDQIRTYTTIVSDAAAWDAKMASKISSKLGVQHRRFPLIEATPKERTEWLESVGFCVGGNVSCAFKSTSTFTAGRVELLGLAGEVGRAYYGWDVQPSSPVDATILLQKLGLPASPVSVQAANNWLSDLQDYDAQQVMDLLYIEQRLGCWAGPSIIWPGVALSRIAPMSQRYIFEHMLDVPYDLRRQSAIHAAIVELKRPDISRFLYKKKQGIASVPRRAFGKIRRWIRQG